MVKALSPAETGWPGITLVKNMFSFPYKWIAFLLVTVFFLPACTFQLQKELNAQQERISGIERELTRSRKNRADIHSDIDEIKRELQFAKGRLEENSHLTQQTALELKNRLEDLSASLKQTQKEISAVKRNPARPAKKDPAQQPESGTDIKQNRYDGAYALFNAGKYGEARKLFQNFLDSYPRDGLSDNALYWIGKSYFREKKYEKSIAAFEDLIKKFPKSNKAPDAHYTQALAFLEINEPLTAKIILETLIQNFPSSPAASKAKQKHAALK